MEITRNSPRMFANLCFDQHLRNFVMTKIYMVVSQYTECFLEIRSICAAPLMKSTSSKLQFKYLEMKAE